ncbi:MAG: hypothetical protein ABSB70_11425 [Candidatus Velthaea sp.]|jgi:hypothetical protein
MRGALPEIFSRYFRGNTRVCDASLSKNSVITGVCAPLATIARLRFAVNVAAILIGDGNQVARNEVFKFSCADHYREQFELARSK